MCGEGHGGANQPRNVAGRSPRWPHSQTYTSGINRETSIGRRMSPRLHLASGSRAGCPAFRPVHPLHTLHIHFRSTTHPAPHAPERVLRILEVQAHVDTADKHLILQPGVADGIALLGRPVERPRQRLRTPRSADQVPHLAPRARQHGRVPDAGGGLAAGLQRRQGLLGGVTLRRWMGVYGGEPGGMEAVRITLCRGDSSTAHDREERMMGGSGAGRGLVIPTSRLARMA